jgi:hypothetical protein
MKTRLALVLLSGALALSPGFAAAAETAPSDQLEMSMADTGAEHAAAESYFRAKAAEARDEARRHRALASAYVGGKSAQAAPFQKHHRHLADSLEAMAASYEMMARMHAEEAANAS